MLDDVLQVRYDWILAKIGALKEDCAKHIYQIGELLVEVGDGKLYRLGKYRTLNEYIEKAIPVGPTQAYKALRIARNYSVGMVARLGIEACDAYLSYIKSTPEEEAPADILRATIPVARPDGAIARVPVTEATVSQIEAATAVARKAGLPELPAEARGMRTALEGLGLRVKVSFEDGAPGLTVGVFRPEGICDQVAAMARALGCGGRS